MHIITKCRGGSNKVLSDIGIILRHGERISQFSSGHATRFNELVRIGEQKLAELVYQGLAKLKEAGLA